MEFRILGPLEVDDGAGVVELPGKQAALLAILLLRANEVVSADSLIDALWGADPPATASKALQVHVSRLRKVLDDESRLRSRAGGYSLEVRRGELDLHRFQELAGEGRGLLSSGDPNASGVLTEALSLCRGAPLADFSYASFAQAEIGRFEELRLAVNEDRIDAELRLGHHRALVGELEAMVAAAPLRERLRTQLMLALYRCERQAEALEVFQDARRALVDELGIEPARSLRDLHQAILNQETALDWVGQARSAEPEARPAESAEFNAASGIEAEREVRKTVTVVVATVAVASLGDEDLDPETSRWVTSRAFTEIERSVDRHGGVVESVVGEALTAIFGVPTVHENDAVRGIRSADEMRIALAELAYELASERGVKLDFRIGISTGEVVAGPDSGTRLRTTGEPLARSSRLSRGAKAGEVVFDHETWQLVRDIVSAEEADGNRRLTAVSDPITVPTRRLGSPMVGRDRERRRLHDAFEQAVGDGSCQLFTVLGVAGVGKSRLVREFLEDVRGRALVARGRCLPYGEGITFWPLLEVVKELIGLDDVDSPDAARARLIGAFDGEPEADVLALRVAELIGLAEAAAGGEEGRVAVRTLFGVLARKQPLVIVFDDIHWGEPTYLDLIEHLAAWTRDAPILLLCLARPELLDLRPGWGGGILNATAALLEPLSDGDCSQLIENLVGRSERSGAVGARIVEAAEGNPLFVEEMLSMLIDDGLFVRDRDQWVSIGDVSAIRVPPTIQALLAARLDQLEPEERGVIERAAVAGKIFQQSAVVELSSEPLRPGVGEALGTLVRKELIRPERASLGRRTYRFRHLLIRDAAYESIPKEERAELHERFGRWLESTAGERLTEYEEVMGYHLEQAYQCRAELHSVDDAARAIGQKAARTLGNAGRRAFVRSDAPAGVNLISRAIALLDADDPLRVELVPNVRSMQGMNLDMSWADRVLTDAVEAAATTGNRRLAAHALVQRGFLRLFTERDVTSEELIENAERSIAVFEELGDDLGQGRAWRLKAQAHYLGRRAGLCADASEIALAHIRPTGDRFEEQEIIEWLAIALFLGPAPAADAAKRCRRLRAERPDQPLAQALLLTSEAILTAMQGDIPEATRLSAQARTIMTDLGEWIWITFFQLGFIALWDGNPVAAEEELRPGYEKLKTLGSTSHFSSLAHGLANALYVQGRYDEAELLTHECERASRPNDVHSQILWRSIRAKTLAQNGQLESAKLLGRESVELAATSDFHPAHAEALVDLAEVLRLAGDGEGAEAAVDEAVRLYELKGNALGISRARSELHAERIQRPRQRA